MIKWIRHKLQWIIPSGLFLLGLVVYWIRPKPKPSKLPQKQQNDVNEVNHERPTLGDAFDSIPKR